MTAIELAKRFYMPILANDPGSLGAYPYISATGLEAFRRIVDPVMRRIGTETVEHMVLVALDGKLNPIGAEAIGIGIESEVSASNRQMDRYLRQVGAKAFMLLHNHPSQNASPSDADIQLTYKLHDYAMTRGIPLVDHVVVTGSQAVSIRAKTAAQLDGFAIPLREYYEVPFYREDLFTWSVPWIEGPSRNDIGIRFGKGKGRGDPFHDARVFLAAPGVSPQHVPAREIIERIGKEDSDEKIAEIIGTYKAPDGFASPEAIAHLWIARGLLINACKTGESGRAISGPSQLRSLCPVLTVSKVDVAIIGVDARQVPVVIVGGNLADKIAQAAEQEQNVRATDTRVLGKLLASELRALEDYGTKHVLILTRLSKTLANRWDHQWPASWKVMGKNTVLTNKLEHLFLSSLMPLLDIIDCGTSPVGPTG